MNYELWKIRLFTVAFCLILASLFIIQSAQAFIGPSAGQSPGSGGGLLQVTSDRNIGFGTSAPKPGTDAEASVWGHVFTVASTSNPGLSLKNLGASGRQYVLYSHDTGTFGIFDANAGAVRLRIQSNGNIGIGGTNPASSTLHIFGNVQADGSFIGSLSGSLSAANVSSDVFGRLQGNGNFAFPASLGVATSSQAGLPQPLSVYGNAYVSGNVGIGTTGPAAPLDIRTTSGGVNLRLTDSQVSGRRWELWSGNGDVGVGKFSIKDVEVAGAAGHRVVIDSSGNVGIGTTAPARILHLAAAEPYIRFDGTHVDGDYRIGTGDGNLYFTDDSTGIPSITIDDGNVGIGTTLASSTLTVNGDIAFYGGELIFSDAGVNNRDYVRYDDNPFGTSGGTFVFHADTALGGATSSPTAAISAEDAFFLGVLNVSGTGSSFTQPVSVGTPTLPAHAATKSYVDSSISGGTASNSNACSADATCEMNGANLQGGNITGVNKITVTTIDPLYEIQGAKYSTYVSSIVGGVREEYVGRGKLGRNNEYVIDFNKTREGSDLWVWRKIVDFSRDNVDVLTTPYGEAAAIYYKIDGEKIIFGGDKPAEFSYRLIGKRFDWRDWPTFARNQTEETSLIIK